MRTLDHLERLADQALRCGDVVREQGGLRRRTQEVRQIGVRPGGAQTRDTAGGDLGALGWLSTERPSDPHMREAQQVPVVVAVRGGRAHAPARALERLRRFAAELMDRCRIRANQHGIDRLPDGRGARQCCIDVLQRFVGSAEHPGHDAELRQRRDGRILSSNRSREIRVLGPELHATPKYRHGSFELAQVRQDVAERRARVDQVVDAVCALREMHALLGELAGDLEIAAHEVQDEESEQHRHGFRRVA